MDGRLPTLLSLLGFVASSSYAVSTSFIASTDRLSYAGSVTIYDTFQDATLGTNARTGPFTIAQRDAEVFMVQNRPTFSQNINIFQAITTYTTADNTNGRPKDDSGGDNWYSGAGNPNNVIDSFIEHWDAEGHTTQSVSAHWTDSSYSTFALDITGAWSAAAGDGTHGRFYNAGRATGFNDAIWGQFDTWHLSLTASGLHGSDADHDGFVESTDQPTLVTGSFSGIFENKNLIDPLSQGFYRFNVGLSQENWAWDQGDDALNGNFRTSRFGAAAVPEPSGLAVASVSALALIRRRRRIS